MRNSTKLAAFSVLVFFFGIAVLILCILQKTGGHLLYALDDPYIHLALSEQLVHGHYGINAVEPASPSSSILWPFLLIPFAGTRFHSLMPLAWNLLFGALAAALIGVLVSAWPLSGGATSKPGLSWRHYLLATLLLFTANLFSLTIIGMEHVFQVLLSIVCAYAVIAVLQRRPIPVWCLAGALIAPMVRYEDLALSLAVAVACVAVGKWKTGVLLFGSSLLPVILFSVFLHSQGMPVLPVSVMVKGDVYGPSSGLARVIHLLGHNVKADFRLIDHWPTLLLTAFFFYLVVKNRDNPRRIVFAGVALLGFFQLTVGRFGWFHRYEDYAVIFLMLIALTVITELYQPPIALLAVGIACVSIFYIYATTVTPYASQAIYRQQFQMHRFITEFYKGDFAVNDLGLTSFQRSPGSYVLDLYGLASVEAAKQKNKDAPWMFDMVARHHIDLVMIYPYWFQVPGPDVWKPIGNLCETPHAGVLIGDNCVVFYSTRRAADQVIADDMARFARTLPVGSIYTPIR